MTEIRRLTFVVVLTLVCTTSGTSASSTTLEGRESSYDDPAWSPNGRTLAYQSGGSVASMKVKWSSVGVRGVGRGCGRGSA